jgi:hypothetical protein
MKSSKSPIDDSFRDSWLLNESRPLTAKKIDLENPKSQKKVFSRGNPSPKPKRILGKERQTPILSKLRPTKISVDKEKLYNDNMALKVKVNDQKSVIMRYKAKILQLEKELQKKEELSGTLNPSCNNYLVKLLKQTIKDLRQEIENKNLEIGKQKHNMKLSKFLELELEVKAYMDECTRLRHSLEEILKDKEMNESGINKSFENNDSKTLNLMKIIEENNKEIQKLKDKIKGDHQAKREKTPKFQEEFSKATKELESLKKNFSIKEKKFAEEVEKLKESLKDKQKEVTVLKLKLDESNTLIQDLFKELKSLRQKKKSKLVPPKCLQVLYAILLSQKITVNEFLMGLAKGDIIESKQFFNALKKQDESLTQDDLDMVLNYIKSETSLKISMKKLVDYFNTYDFSLVSKDSREQKVLDLFDHLNLRMQLHRIPKENLIEALLGAGASSSKPIHNQEIVLLLTNSPFNFSRKQATLLVDSLFSGEKSLPYSSFIEKFYSSLSDWQVFTSSDEESFDNYLLSLVGKHKESIEKFCQRIDTENKETIPLEEFFSGLESNQITITSRLKDYLVVLFYSHNMELNAVPYKQFLQAYSNSEDSQEDPKTLMVQKHLDQIANKLIQSKKSVREIFNFDEGGLIVAEDFIEALKNIGIPEISKENLLVLLEALQYDPEQRIVCIHVDELEDILETYGVPAHSNVDISGIFSDSENLADSFEGHVQKISLLDSAQLELTEFSEPGRRSS